MNLKIGKYNYTITEADDFMDNGACVQLLTQSKENTSWGRTPNPVLSKKAIKQISAYKRVDKDHNYGTSVQIFSLSLIKNKELHG